MSPPQFEILAHESTPLGLLLLRRRQLLTRPDTSVTEVTLNHEFLMSSLHTDSERALASTALAMHDGEDLDVLVGGFGLGYTAQAALASARVRRVEVVELLPQVIGWLKQGLIPLSAELNAEPRLEVVEGDVYARLAAPPERAFDLILIDVDHSPDEPLDVARGAFYREEGLGAARRHLAPGGVLAVWSYAESSPFTEALRAVFPEVRVEAVTFQNELVDQEHTDWLFFARS
jgi:spermidine synthase